MLLDLKVLNPLQYEQVNVYSEVNLTGCRNA